MTWVLRGRNEAGETRYYTGRAGEFWLSPNGYDAFDLEEGEAKRKAALHNKMTPLHGFTFEAEDISPPRSSYRTWATARKEGR